MKPLRLVMSAFGSYGASTEISFEQSNHGLFLITGDTGSGKTTIFDAISYALYDQTSGKSREGNMMRSQYATPDTATFVEFVFIYRQEQYRIKRNPDYQIEKYLKNGTVKQQNVISQVELELPDGSIYPGKKRETNAKIQEIIGLDVNQFSQVAMIAQGDFLKLLFTDGKEKSGTRKEILAHIFQTDVYWKITEQLKSKSKDSDEQLMGNAQACRQEMNRIFFKEERSNEEWSAFLQKDSIQKEEMMLVLKNCIKRESENESRIQREKEENKIQLEQLNIKLNQAVSENNLFEAYDKALEEQKQFVEKADAMKMLQDTIDLAKRAEKVIKYRERLLLVKREYNDGKIQEEEILKWLKEEQPRTEELQKHTGILEQEKDSKSILWDKTIAQVDAALTGYEDSEKLLGQLRKLVPEAKDVNVISFCQIVEEKWKYSINEADSIRVDYRKELQDFLHAQAGNLARNLQEGDPCPVCGSVHHPNLAVNKDDTISEEQLKKLERQVQQAEKEAQDSHELFIRVEQLEKEWKKVLTHLPFETKEEALQKKEEATKEKDKAILLLNRTRKEAEDSINLMNQKRGMLSTLTKQLKLKEKECIDTEMEYKEKLLENGFASENEFIDSIMTEETIKQNESTLLFYHRNIAENEGRRKSLLQALAGKERQDTSKWVAQKENLEFQAKSLEHDMMEQHSRNVGNENARECLLNYLDKREKIVKQDQVIKNLYYTAAGKIKGSTKIDLETYVQRRYFRQIILEANKRLFRMSSGQFILELKEEQDAGLGRNEGLDLCVRSMVTNSTRDVKTLSGGESFLAALSMALGLADIIERTAGAIHLDMMFIDEGFGSLDERSRELAISVLNELAGSDRLVGIISHVTELKEQIERKLIIEKTDLGSNCRWEGNL